MKNHDLIKKIEADLAEVQGIIKEMAERKYTVNTAIKAQDDAAKFQWQKGYAYALSVILDELKGGIQ